MKVTTVSIGYYEIFLCKSKKEGGLDFRCLEHFNTKLLAKELWRLYQFPDSLVARVFKRRRHFRNSHPLKAKKAHSPSLDGIVFFSKGCLDPR